VVVNADADECSAVAGEVLGVEGLNYCGLVLTNLETN
jgi:hypothetical protein